MILCWRRIYAVFLRYFYMIAGLHQVAELFFWPLVDILLWGLTTVWLQQQQNAAPIGSHHFDGAYFLADRESRHI